MHFPIEYDPQTGSYFVVDDRPHATDRFASQHETQEEAEEARARLLATAAEDDAF